MENKLDTSKDNTPEEIKQVVETEFNNIETFSGDDDEEIYTAGLAICKKYTDDLKGENSRALEPFEKLKAELNDKVKEIQGLGWFDSLTLDQKQEIHEVAQKIDNAENEVLKRLQKSRAIQTLTELVTNTETQGKKSVFKVDQYTGIITFTKESNPIPIHQALEDLFKKNPNQRYIIDYSQCESNSYKGKRIKEKMTNLIRADICYLCYDQAKDTYVIRDKDGNPRGDRALIWEGVNLIPDEVNQWEAYQKKQTQNNKLGTFDYKDNSNINPENDPQFKDIIAIIPSKLKSQLLSLGPQEYRKFIIATENRLASLLKDAKSQGYELANEPITKTRFTSGLMELHLIAGDHEKNITIWDSDKHGELGNSLYDLLDDSNFEDDYKTYLTHRVSDKRKELEGMTKIETVNLSKKTTTQETSNQTPEELAQALQTKEKKKSDILYGIDLFEKMVANFKESEGDSWDNDDQYLANIQRLLRNAKASVQEATDIDEKVLQEQFIRPLCKEWGAFKDPRGFHTANYRETKRIEKIFFGPQSEQIQAIRDLGGEGTLYDYTETSFLAEEIDTNQITLKDSTLDTYFHNINNNLEIKDNDSEAVKAQKKDLIDKLYQKAHEDKDGTTILGFLCDESGENSLLPLLPKSWATDSDVQKKALEIGKTLKQQEAMMNTLTEDVIIKRQEQERLMLEAKEDKTEEDIQRLQVLTFLSQNPSEASTEYSKIINAEKEMIKYGGINELVMKSFVTTFIDKADGATGTNTDLLNDIVGVGSWYDLSDENAKFTGELLVDIAITIAVSLLTAGTGAVVMGGILRIGSRGAKGLKATKLLQKIEKTIQTLSKLKSAKTLKQTFNVYKNATLGEKATLLGITASEKVLEAPIFNAASATLNAAIHGTSLDSLNLKPLAKENLKTAAFLGALSLGNKLGMGIIGKLHGAHKLVAFSKAGLNDVLKNYKGMWTESLISEATAMFGAEQGMNFVFGHDVIDPVTGEVETTRSLQRPTEGERVQMIGMILAFKAFKPQLWAKYEKKLNDGTLQVCRSTNKNEVLLRDPKTGKTENIQNLIDNKNNNNITQEAREAKQRKNISYFDHAGGMIRLRKAKNLPEALKKFADANNDYKKLTIDDIKALQREIGLTGKEVDGIIGPKTVNQLKIYLNSENYSQLHAQAAQQRSEIAAKQAELDEIQSRINENNANYEQAQRIKELETKQKDLEVKQTDLKTKTEDLKKLQEKLQERQKPKNIVNRETLSNALAGERNRTNNANDGSMTFDVNENYTGEIIQGKDNQAGYILLKPKNGGNNIRINRDPSAEYWKIINETGGKDVDGSQTRKDRLNQADSEIAEEIALALPDCAIEFAKDGRDSYLEKNEAEACKNGHSDQHLEIWTGKNGNIMVRKVSDAEGTLNQRIKTKEQEIKTLSQEIDAAKHTIQDLQGEQHQAEIHHTAADKELQAKQQQAEADLATAKQQLEATQKAIDNLEIGIPEGPAERASAEAEAETAKKKTPENSFNGKCKLDNISKETSEILSNLEKGKNEKAYLEVFGEPSNELVLPNGESLYLSNRLIYNGREFFVGYVKKGNALHVRLFYKSNSEGTRRSCPGIRDDGNLSKGENLRNSSYETTTQVPREISAYFDQIKTSDVTVSPISMRGSKYHDGKNNTLGIEILQSEMELEITVDKIFDGPRDTVDFMRGKKVSEVKEMYKNYCNGKDIDINNMSLKPQETFTYQHQHLGEVQVDVCILNINGKPMEVLFAHATKNNPGQVWIENIRYPDAKINSFGLYEKTVNAAPLTCKPIEYKSQVPNDCNGKTYGNSYMDIRDLYQENPIIVKYKELCKTKAEAAKAKAKSEKPATPEEERKITSEERDNLNKKIAEAKNKTPAEKEKVADEAINHGETDVKNAEKEQEDNGTLSDQTKKNLEDTQKNLENAEKLTKDSKKVNILKRLLYKIKELLNRNGYGEFMKSLRSDKGLTIDVTTYKIIEIEGKKFIQKTAANGKKIGDPMEMNYKNLDKLHKEFIDTQKIVKENEKLENFHKQIHNILLQPELSTEFNKFLKQLKEKTISYKDAKNIWDLLLKKDSAFLELTNRNQGQKVVRKTGFLQADTYEVDIKEGKVSLHDGKREILSGEKLIEEVMNGDILPIKTIENSKVINLDYEKYKNEYPELLEGVTIGKTTYKLILDVNNVMKIERTRGSKKLLITEFGKEDIDRIKAAKEAFEKGASELPSQLLDATSKKETYQSQLNSIRSQLSEINNQIDGFNELQTQFNQKQKALQNFRLQHFTHAKDKKIRIDGVEYQCKGIQKDGNLQFKRSDKNEYFTISSFSQLSKKGSINGLGDRTTVQNKERKAGGRTASEYERNTSDFWFTAIQQEQPLLQEFNKAKQAIAPLKELQVQKTQLENQYKTTEEQLNQQKALIENINQQLQDLNVEPEVGDQAA